MNTKTKFDFNFNVLVLFTFYTLPSVGKSKGAVVHSVDLSIKAHQLIKTFQWKKTIFVTFFQSNKILCQHSMESFWHISFTCHTKINKIMLLKNFSGWRSGAQVLLDQDCCTNLEVLCNFYFVKILPNTCLWLQSYPGPQFGPSNPMPNFVEIGLAVWISSENIHTLLYYRIE